MAAASAGDIHVGPVSVPAVQHQSAPSAIIHTSSHLHHRHHHHHHHSQNHQTLPLQHNNHIANIPQQSQRISYVQRAGNGNHVNVVSEVVDDAPVVQGPVTKSVIPQQQQRGPNVAPGWRRHISNGEIIYVRWVIRKIYLFLALYFSQCLNGAIINMRCVHLDFL